MNSLRPAREQPGVIEIAFPHAQNIIKVLGITHTFDRGAIYMVDGNYVWQGKSGIVRVMSPSEVNNMINEESLFQRNPERETRVLDAQTNVTTSNE